MRKLSLIAIILLLNLGLPTVAQESGTEPEPQLLIGEFIETEILDDKSLLIQFSIDFIGELQTIDPGLAMQTGAPLLADISYEFGVFFTDPKDFEKIHDLLFREEFVTGRVELDQKRLNGPIDIKFTIEKFCEALTFTSFELGERVVLTIDASAIGTDFSSDGLYRDFAFASSAVDIQKCLGSN